MSVPPPLPPISQPSHQTPTPLSYAVPADGIICPRCGQYGAKPVGYSWWGGVIGPKLLSHTKCPNCKFTFNRKTGRSNNTAIAIYLGVGVVLGLIVAVFVFLRG